MEEAVVVVEVAVAVDAVDSATEDVVDVEVAVAVATVALNAEKKVTLAENARQVTKELNIIRSPNRTFKSETYVSL